MRCAYVSSPIVRRLLGRRPCEFKTALTHINGGTCVGCRFRRYISGLRTLLCNTLVRAMFDNETSGSLLAGTARLESSKILSDF